MSAARVFAIPVLLALASTLGLVAGLLGDGAWDVLACVALASPMAVLALCIARPTRREGQRAIDRADRT